MRCQSILRAGALVALLAPLALANQGPFSNHPDAGRLQWTASDRSDDRDGQHVWCRGDCSEPLANELEDWEQPVSVVEQEEFESMDNGRQALSFPYPHKPKESNETILGFLATHPGFSRLFKIVNVSEEIISVLNDTSSNVTFFAVPNHAIPASKNRTRVHGRMMDLSAVEDMSAAAELWDLQTTSLADLIAEAEAFDSLYASAQPDDRHKEIFKRIVTAVLKYHILPQKLNGTVLKSNATYATSLAGPFGALDGQAVRLRVQPSFPFGFTVNFFSKVIVPNIDATNGIVHVINHPLLPPPSIFQELFLLQRPFSTLTSALGRVGLSKLTEYRPVHAHDSAAPTIEGSPIVTIFAPSNKAFASLPRKLQFFLFSPFGERVLKKLLQFHIVPNVTLHSDYILNGTSDALEVLDFDYDAFLGQALDNDDEAQLSSHMGHVLEEDEEDSCAEDEVMDEGVFDEDDETEECACGRSEEENDELDGGSLAGEEDWGQSNEIYIPRPHLPRPPSRKEPKEKPTPPPTRKPGPPVPLSRRPKLPPPPRRKPEPPAPPSRKPKLPSRRPGPPKPPSPPSRKPGPGHSVPPRRRPGPPGSPPHRGPPPHRRPHLPHPFPRSPPDFAANITVQTALTNHTLSVQVIKFTLKSPLPGHKPIGPPTTLVIVNGQKVEVADGVALNGAVHVVHQLLNPRPHSHHGPPRRHPGPDERDLEEVLDEEASEWDDWEDWLPAWADDNGF